MNELSIVDNSNICFNNPCLDGLRHFKGYHVYVHEESDTSLLGSNEYEMKLYEDYIKREGKSFAIERGWLIRSSHN